MPRRRNRRFYRRRYRRRGVVRKRAAAQQRQTSRFIVKSTMVSNLLIDPTGPGATDNERLPNFAGTAVISAYNNLVRSSYFSSIAKMYDQVRLDWVKVKITPTMSVLLQNQKQAVFVSAWDRNGVTNPTEPPNFAEICSHSSAFQRAINMDATVWSATRKIFATSLAEKSFFLPTSFIQSIPNGKDAMDTGFNIPPGQSISVPWNPQLLIGILLSASTYNGGVRPVIPQNTQTWNFFLEFEWGLTFRGLRFDLPNAGMALIDAAIARKRDGQTVLGANDPDDQDAMVPADNISSIPQYQAQPGVLTVLSLYSRKGNTPTQIPIKGGYYRLQPNTNGSFVIDATSDTNMLFFYISLGSQSSTVRFIYVAQGQSFTLAAPAKHINLLYPIRSGFPGTWADKFSCNYVQGQSEVANTSLSVTDFYVNGASTASLYGVNALQSALTIDASVRVLPMASCVYEVALVALLNNHTAVAWAL